MVSKHLLSPHIPNTATIRPPNVSQSQNVKGSSRSCFAHGVQSVWNVPHPPALRTAHWCIRTQPRDCWWNWCIPIYWLYVYVYIVWNIKSGLNRRKVGLACREHMGSSWRDRQTVKCYLMLSLEALSPSVDSISAFKRCFKSCNVERLTISDVTCNYVSADGGKGWHVVACPSRALVVLYRMLTIFACYVLTFMFGMLFLFLTTSLRCFCPRILLFE